MKRRLLYIFIVFIAIISIIIFTKKDYKKDLQKITVAEVTHSIFYTPWYVAINNGYFKEEGLDIELLLTPGADKVISAVLSGDANIGLSGPEATIYTLENGNKDYIINFAGLTRRDGQFIFGSCDEKDRFNINNLKGKHILVGRSGGMPQMIFSYALKENGIKEKDLNMDTSIEFAALSGSYISGIGDYVNLFDNSVTKEKEK